MEDDKIKYEFESNMDKPLSLAADHPDCVVDTSHRPKTINGNRAFSGQDLYEDHYPEIAYKILSSGYLKSKSHIAAALKVSKPTIDNWANKYPEFREALVLGLSIGEKLFREKVASHTFEPTSKVNNGLIKLLGANVYGIKDEIAPIVIIDHGPRVSAAEEMAARGIPMPDFNTPDVTAGLQSSKSNFEEDTEEDIRDEKDPGYKAENNTLYNELAKENAILRAKIAAKELTILANRNKGIKGFGSDFLSADADPVSPFGD